MRERNRKHHEWTQRALGSARSEHMYPRDGSAPFSLIWPAMDERADALPVRTAAVHAAPRHFESRRRRATARLHCELLCHSNGPHLQQIYTGFRLLRRRGLIDLQQRIVRQPIDRPDRVQHLRSARQAHLRVLVNGAVRLHYDAHDAPEVDDEYLAQADHYFKRSYDEARLQREGYDLRKIHPLGLNYEVYPDGFDASRLHRILSLDPGLKEKARRTVRIIPRVHEMESLPDYDAPPRILFMTKAWDPLDQPERIAEKIEERAHLNEMRANCIRRLRAEFGSRFFGGFVHAQFARRQYRDTLMPQGKLGSKRNYLALLRSYPICVATTGLHGSVGWKFAEYVCLSKAIVSEKLLYGAPGDLSEGRNYLQFATPAQCLEQAHRLFSDRELRRRIMSNNARYYQAWLRPDALILNSLLTACRGEPVR